MCVFRFVYACVYCVGSRQVLREGRKGVNMDDQDICGVHDVSELPDIPAVTRLTRREQTSERFDRIRS